MVDAASDETVAKWKMAVVSPRVPHLSKKLISGNYTVTAGTNDEFTIEVAGGGFLSTGIAAGDMIFGSSDLANADSKYYDTYGEPYSSAALAKVVSVVTASKIVVKTIVSGFDLVSGLSGQNVVIGAINTHQDLIDAISSKAKSISRKGVVLVFPDKYEVGAGDSVKLIPGYMASAVVNAVMAHLPPQQGLSNLSFNSFTKVIGSSFYFTDGELDEIASAGVFVVIQQNYSSKPYVLRQLTTDMGSLETMEINKVRCLDYATLAFASKLDDYIGKRNVVDTNINDIKRQLDYTGQYLVNETVQPYLGPVITEYDIVDVYSPETEPDAISCVIDVKTPTSLNKIRLYVTSGKKQ
jgi:hypothetical protein